MVAERRLHIWKTLAFRNTAPHTNHVPSPAAAPKEVSIHHNCCTLQRLHFIFQEPMACPRVATHTLAGLCAL